MNLRPSNAHSKINEKMPSFDKLRRQLSDVLAWNNIVSICFFWRKIRPSLWISSKISMMCEKKRQQTQIEWIRALIFINAKMIYTFACIHFFLSWLSDRNKIWAVGRHFETSPTLLIFGCLGLVCVCASWYINWFSLCVFQILLFSYFFYGV